ncbi:ROK family protein [Streptomyces sp. NPDC050997]|uniref:ROK family protein n=1 Tax=Streptomyces sp. NPDC050997 TaxID=3155519 RepID=UPI0034179CBF
MPLPVVPVLEVGGSHVTAAAVDLDRARIADGTRRRLPLTSGVGPEDFLAALAEAANGMLSATALGARAVGGTWGIAVPGPFDYARGIARYHGVGKFASLDGLAVGTLLTPRLNRPPARLRFLNDASAFALGAWHMAHTQSRRLVAITLGTGVGSAFLDRGTLVEDDPCVPPEGRVDLLTVDGGPLEDTASTRAMTAHYTNRTGRPVDGLRELTALAAADDVIARDVITSALRDLGGALAPWLTAFEADTVAFGGSITAAWPLIGPPLTAGLTHHDPRLRRLALSVHGDGEDKALVGAAVFAAREA